MTVLQLGRPNFTQQFAINGQRGVEAVFAMDGADVSESRNGREHVHEFQRRCQRSRSCSRRLGLDAGGHRARCGRFHQYL